MKRFENKKSFSFFSTSFLSHLINLIFISLSHRIGFFFPIWAEGEGKRKGNKIKKPQKLYV